MIPKFRAWDIENREMIRVDEINFGMEIVGTYIGTDERGDPGFGYLNFKQVILMQSTGLKDKNGVEIYEGDVVELNVPTYKTTTKTIGDLYDAFILDKNVESSDYIEVLGNIYEHPELLEEQNK